MTTTPCPNCTWPHHCDFAVTLVCRKCGATVHIGQTKAQLQKERQRELRRQRVEQRRKGHDKLIEWLRQQALPGEPGAGTTADRLLRDNLHPDKHKQIKHLLAVCGCQRATAIIEADRRDSWA